jgi:hypothetical protein
MLKSDRFHKNKDSFFSNLKINIIIFLLDYELFIQFNKNYISIYIASKQVVFLIKKMAIQSKLIISGFNFASN